MKKRSAYAVKLAGAAVLAGSTQAYGQIISITPPTNITNPSPTGGTDPGAVNVQHEGYNVLTGVTTPGPGLATDDFLFGYYISGGDYFSQSYIKGLKSTSLVASANAYSPVLQATYLYANALPKGANIPDALSFNQAGAPGIYLTSVAADGTVTTPSNYQQPNTDEYLGFQFTDSNDNQIHYGWIELDSVTYPGSNLSGINFIAAAYNAQPGAAILAGEVETPEPGTISSLLLGAAALGGVGLMRRRRAGLATVQN
jgi:hypothetical protein